MNTRPTRWVVARPPSHVHGFKSYLNPLTGILSIWQAEVPNFASEERAKAVCDEWGGGLFHPEPLKLFPWETK